MRHIRSETRTVDRRGVVLVVVLVLVVLIALAGFGFAGSMTTEREAARLAGYEKQADQALLSAELFLQRLAAQPSSMRQPAEADEFRFRGIPLSATAGNSSDLQTLSPSTWQFSLLSRQAQSTDFPDGNQAFRFGFENESNRLHLGAILQWELRQPGSGRRVLLKLRGMTPETADAILDWIDPDNVPREFGFESGGLSDQPAYRVPNRVPETLEELLLVRGVTRDLLYGPDTNRNYRIDADESALPEANTFDRFSTTSFDDPGLPDAAGWADILTVHSAARNLNPAGQPRIHLNDPNLANLAARLELIVTPDVANFIILLRQYGTSIGAGTTDAGSVAINLTVPGRFRIDSPAALVDATVLIPGSSPLTVRSPIRSDTPELRELLHLLMSEASPIREPTIRGQFNLNTASESIVRMLPFFSEDTTERILAHRRTLEESARESTTWLLTEGLVDPAKYATVEPWLTAGGDVLRSQIIVLRAAGGPIRRVEAVIDGASREPRRVEWRDLRASGLAFPKSLLLQPPPAEQQPTSPTPASF